jgi:hypothetical protein
MRLEETMPATHADADLILKLYELRREPVMRRARAFMMSLDPVDIDEIVMLQRDSFGSEENGWYRQVIGYWEMAASFVLRGLIDPDLFLDCNGENIFLYARFTSILEPYMKTFGFPFMPRTGELIQTYPAMQERYTLLLAMLKARRERTAEANRPLNP